MYLQNRARMGLSAHLNSNRILATLHPGRNARKLSSHSKMSLAARSVGHLAYL